MVKVLQLENYERALRARGLQTSMRELGKGIPEVCKAHGVKPEELGVKGCLLIYRRREEDMALAQPPDNATPEQIAKTEQVRQKMLRLGKRSVSTSGRSVGWCGRWPFVDTFVSVHLGNKWTFRSERSLRENHRDDDGRWERSAGSSNRL